MYDKELKSDVFDEVNYPDGIDSPLTIINIIDSYFENSGCGEELLFGDWKKLQDYMQKNIVY